ncbi:MAG TPA: hypothetical protein VLA70_03690 [Nocardioides sp.]|nr:hypothetical protein [Nocardioides sp.]
MGSSQAWEQASRSSIATPGRSAYVARSPLGYADLPDHVRSVHTWTAPSNTAMHVTNTALGFRVVEHMYEVEARIA